MPYVGVEITSNFCPLGIDEKPLPRHNEENLSISLNAALTCIFFFASHTQIYWSFHSNYKEISLI